MKYEPYRPSIGMRVWVQTNSQREAANAAEMRKCCVEWKFEVRACVRSVMIQCLMLMCVCVGKAATGMRKNWTVR